MKTISESPFPTQSIELKDGSVVTFESYGSGRKKVFYFHGFPASRCQGRLLAPFCERFDLEIVSFDRAGYGQSGRPASGRSHSIDAVRSMAEHLKWDRFHLLAVSGGAPHALLCAAILGKQVESLHLVAGLGPLGDDLFRRAFARKYLYIMRTVRHAPQFVIDHLITRGLEKMWRERSEGKKSMQMPLDVEAINQPEVGGILLESIRESFRQGGIGAKIDAQFYLSPRSFEWRDISCPTTLWHGKQDDVVPSRFSEFFAEHIPGATLNLMDQEAHYSLPLRNVDKILSAIGSVY